MGERKITLTIDEAMYSELSEKAKLEGFGRVSTLVRHLAVTNMKVAVKQVDGCHVIKVPVGNYDELLHYVNEKRIGTVETFAPFAMKQYMTRYPPVAVQKARARESVEE